MSQQQNYNAKIQQILQKNPHIKLEDLVYLVFDEKISMNNVFTILTLTQQAIQKDKQDLPVRKFAQNLTQVQAKQLYISEILYIIQKCQPLLQSEQQSEKFEEKGVLKQNQGQNLHKPQQVPTNQFVDSDEKGQKYQRHSEKSDFEGQNRKETIQKPIVDQQNQEVEDQKQSRQSFINEFKDENVSNANKSNLDKFDLKKSDLNKSNMNESNLNEPDLNGSKPNKTNLNNSKTSKTNLNNSKSNKSHSNSPNLYKSDGNQSNSNKVPTQQKGEGMVKAQNQSRISVKKRTQEKQKNEQKPTQNEQNEFAERQIDEKYKSFLHSQNNQQEAKQIESQKEKADYSENKKNLSNKTNRNQVQMDIGIKSNSPLTKQNKQSDNEYLAHFEQLQPEVIPNFHNEKELEQLDQDKINHRNLYDDTKIQIIEQPKTELQRSMSYLSKEYDRLRLILDRFLIAVYYEYLSNSQKSSEIVEKVDVFKKPIMDLTLFLKFYKDFQVKDLLKVNYISKIFKTQARNRLWVDVQKFLTICHAAVQKKNIQNSEGTLDVTDQNQLIQRVKKFTLFFTKQRIKTFLKLNNKEHLDKIIVLYNTRNSDSESRVQGNKDEIVEKFLKRNFEGQLKKWYDKKNINVDKIKKYKKSSDKSDSENRDEKSISNSIKKLKSQSEKNLTQLRSLLNEDFLTNIKTEIKNKIMTKKPAHKNITEIVIKPKVRANQKKAVSIYKEMSEFGSVVDKFIKIQEKQFNKNLKINEVQPFLNAYFKSQAVLKKNIELHGKQVNSAGAQKKGAASLIKNPQKNTNSQQNLPRLKIDPSPAKKTSSLTKLKPLKPNQMNQFISSSQQLQILRKMNNRSQPSNPNPPQASNRKRVQSMKKLLQPKQSNRSLDLLQGHSQMIPIYPLMNKNNIKLNSKQNQLINKKLFDSIQKGINILGLNLNNQVRIPGTKIAAKNIKSAQSSTQSWQIKQSSQNIENKPLLNNYEQELYQLFKYFNGRGMDKEQTYIINREDKKRKGYIVVEDNKGVNNQMKKVNGK